MNMMWLCPINGLAPFVLGAGRIPSFPSTEMDSFRRELRRIHPRLLMMFKANVLLGEPTESDLFADKAERCGMGKVPFSLAENKEIRFDTHSLALSACANAFIARLLPQAEATQLIDAMGPLKSAEQQIWLRAMQGWMRQGKHVILIQEDRLI